MIIFIFNSRNTVCKGRRIKQTRDLIFSLYYS